MDTNKLVKYLRSSLALNYPEIVRDDAYKFTNEELADVLEMMIPVQNPSYTKETFPKEEEYFLILLAKKEIYYRLATAMAPLYPLSAEGAELRKDYRFEHYMSLIRRVEIEYAQMWEKFENSQPLEVGDLFIERNHFSNRNYENAVRPTVELKVHTVRSNSVDISWTKFDVPRGKFLEYNIYVSKSPIYDEFIESIDKGAKKIARILDIHRTKYRIDSLEPNTEYYIAVTSEDANTLTGVSEQKILTTA